MKKKLGFTLAEVLITLGIIGVVAALTAPALVQNAGTAKVGPTLAKVVSTLENAHEQILHDEDTTKLSSVAKNADEYMDVLSKYISGSSYDTDNKIAPNPEYKSYEKQELSVDSSKIFKFSDSISIIFQLNSFANCNNDTYTPKGSFKGEYCYFYIDINGINKAPNSLGKDLFVFYVDKSGQILPSGSSTLAWLHDDDVWKYTSSNSFFTCNEKEVITGIGCAGSIFENDLKVIYE